MREMNTVITETILLESHGLLQLDSTLLASRGLLQLDSTLLAEPTSLGPIPPHVVITWVFKLSFQNHLELILANPTCLCCRIV